MSSSAPAAGVRRSDIEDNYFEFDRPEIRELVPQRAKRVLDVGCGGGAFGAALKAERGIEVKGVELFPDAAARAADRLDEVQIANLDGADSLPFEEGYFDAITFGDVLEHLRDPHGLLATAKRYLAPGGVIVASIPNVKHWTVVFSLLVQDRWEYTDAGLLDRTHVHFFTLEEIGLMLEETGYEALHVGSVNMGSIPKQLELLIETARVLGAEADECEARLNAYQYLIVAKPAA
jgi:2-polyprenyl-3-methyl-5-hydroxy-6-metoxy-1,4-benzoquinol methylase